MKNRIFWADVTKAIAMLIIVFWHVMMQTKLKLYISPNLGKAALVCFFVMSGFFAKPSKLTKWELTKKLFYAYLAPLYLWGIMLSAVFYVLKPFSLTDYIKRFLYFEGFTFYMINPAWFLVNLFMTVLIFHYLNLGKLNVKLKIAVSLVCFALIEPVSAHCPNYFGLFRLPVSLGFYMFGNAMKYFYDILASKENKFVYVNSVLAVSLIIFVFFCFKNLNVSVAQGRFKGSYMLLYLCGTLSGTFIYCFLGYKLKNVKFLREYGQNTLFTLITHKTYYWCWTFLLFKILPLILFRITLIPCYALIIFTANPICRFLSEHCPILLGKPAKNKKTE